MNHFLNEINLQIFGSSHSKYIGGVINGVPPGLEINISEINDSVKARKGGNSGTTSRIERDEIIWMTGIVDNKTTGLPIAFSIENKNVMPQDYSFEFTPRPGHADFTQIKKFGEYADISGGGQSSGG